MRGPPSGLAVASTDAVVRAGAGGVAFGWTDIANPRGAGLPMMLAPIMNTLRRWSMKQAVVLAPGANVVYCNSKPAGGDAGGFAFADPANFFWPHAQTRVSTDIEFGTLADMNAADVRVAGTTFVGEVSGTRNIAAKIVNSGAAPVTVTLVWHFEAFVTNYDGLW